VPYADVETLIADWLTATLTLRAGTGDLPTNLAYLLPYVHVARYGGADATVSIDAANVDIDVYASTPAAAKTIAEQVRVAVRLRLPGHTAAGLTVSRLRTIAGPALRDYESTQVFLATASYQATVHTHTLAH
jgi:hypothetical protein